MLCEAESAETGAMWECPLLCRLPTRPELGRVQNLSSLRQAGGLGPAFGGSCGGAAGPPSGPASPAKGGASALPPLPRKASFTGPPGGGAPAGPPGGARANGGAGPPPERGEPREPAAGAEAGAVGTMPPPPDAQTGRSLLTEQLGAGGGPGPGQLAATAEAAAENGGMHDGGAGRRAGVDGGLSRRASVDGGPGGRASADGGAREPAFTHFLCVSPDAPTNPVRARRPGPQLGVPPMFGTARAVACASRERREADACHIA